MVAARSKASTSLLMMETQVTLSKLTLLLTRALDLIQVLTNLRLQRCHLITLAEHIESLSRHTTKLVFQNHQS